MTESDGIPDYADENSTAYDERDRPRLDDAPAALPTDEPEGVDAWGTTPEEEERGEPLAARLVREEPEVGVDDEYDSPDPVGRLVEPDEGAHEDADAESFATDSGEVGEESAEEAAIHELPENE